LQLQLWAQLKELLPERVLAWDEEQKKYNIKINYIIKLKQN